MVVPRGPRAAHQLVTGRTYEPKRDLTISLIPGLIAMAEQYRICAPLGRNGCIPIGQYLEEKLIEDIRKKEKERENLPVNQ